MRLHSRNVASINFSINLIIFVLIIVPSIAAFHQPVILPAIPLPSSSSASYVEDTQFNPIDQYAHNDEYNKGNYEAELEIPDGRQSFLNEAELIQDEERHLRLINPDVEKLSMGVSGSGSSDLTGKNVSFEANERASPYADDNYDDYAYREFVPVNSRNQDRNLKLHVRMNLGKHQMPPLEYRLPRHWLTRQSYRGTSSRSGVGRRKSLNSGSQWNNQRSRGYSALRTDSRSGGASRSRENLYTRRLSSARETGGASRSRENPNSRRLSSPRERGMEQPRVGSWGGWSPCSATCGKSFRARVRSCSLPGKCDRQLLRQKQTCNVPAACHGGRNQQGNLQPAGRSYSSGGRSSVKQNTARGSTRRNDARKSVARAPSKRPSPQQQKLPQGCQKEYFAHKLPAKSFICPLSRKAFQAKWTSRIPFLFPLADAKSEPTDKTHLEIKFGKPRTLTGWKITGSVGKGREGAVSTYLVKVFQPSLNAWKFVAGTNHIPRVFMAASRDRKAGQKRIFTAELIPVVPMASMIRFYPLQWSGKPYFKVDVEACTLAKPTVKVNKKKPGPAKKNTRAPRKRRRPIKKPRPKKPLGPNQCARIPSKEIFFSELDYDKKVENLKHLPDLHGEGYVNLRLLTTIKTSQNHNNHVSLEVDLGRTRKVEQLLFKGGLREGLPAMLRAFYLQFQDPQDNEWRWVSLAGKPTPFIITDIPVLNKEQVQTVFSVRFPHGLITRKLRIFPELWQKLPLIRMGVIACGP